MLLFDVVVGCCSLFVCYCLLFDSVSVIVSSGCWLLFVVRLFLFVVCLFVRLFAVVCGRWLLFVVCLLFVRCLFVCLFVCVFVV